MSAEITVYTTEEVAKMMRTNAEHVRQLCLRGTLKAIKFGHFWRIQHEDLQAFIKERGATGLAELADENEQ